MRGVSHRPAQGYAAGLAALGSAAVRGRTYRYVRNGALAVMADTVAALALVGTAYWLAGRAGPATAALHLDAASLVTIAGSLAMANAWMGLYLNPCLGSVERFRRRVLGALLMPWLALALLSWEEPPHGALIALLAATAAALIPLGVVVEACLRRLCPSACSATALLLGTSAEAEQIAAYLQSRPELGLRPLGRVHDTPGSSARLPWLGRSAELDRLAAEVDVVVLAPSASFMLPAARNLPVRHLAVFSQSERPPALSLVARQIGGAVMFGLHNPRQEGFAGDAKRLFELAVAVPALVVAVPVIAVAALAIKLVSPGPVLFVQYRVGWRGERIPVHKLRSMYPDAEARLARLLAEDPEARREWDTHMKLKRDPRILPYIGAFIRKTSIDELPQLWDVVNGTIALVGPRPFPGYHIEKFPARFQSLRASVKPGLTGLWQVSDRSDADLHQQEAIDTFYVRNWSLWLDAYIIARTFAALIFPNGAR